MTQPKVTITADFAQIRQAAFAAQDAARAIQRRLAFTMLAATRDRAIRKVGPDFPSVGARMAAAITENA